MDSPSSPKPYENMSIDGIIIAEYTDDYDDQVFKNYTEDRQQEGGSLRSCRKKRSHIDRGREEGHQRLFDDYFSEQPVYGENLFRRRFRMRRHVYLRIVEALGNYSDYFQMKFDTIGRKGLSPIQKCTAALRMLAYGVAADSVDEYVWIDETNAIKCLAKFVRGISELFVEEYLRRPNPDDIHRLLQIGEAHRFKGMLGSIDCMHSAWKNCPVAWKGQFTRGDHGMPTIMLEAVTSQDLWIWHAFFGVPGSNNDLNVLNQSPLFTDILQGRAPPVEFMINGTQNNMGCYLTDDIYPEWGTFVNTISLPQGEKRQLIARHQEGARKDVERAFEVLQSRFAIIQGLARLWEMNVLKDIMYACIILHNMIVEDERNSVDGRFDFNYDEGPTPAPRIEVSHGPISDFSTMLQRNAEILYRNVHYNLQADLVELIWSRFGAMYE